MTKLCPQPQPISKVLCCAELRGWGDPEAGGQGTLGQVASAEGPALPQDRWQHKGASAEGWGVLCRASLGQAWCNPPAGGGYGKSEAISPNGKLPGAVPVAAPQPRVPGPVLSLGWARKGPVAHFPSQAGKARRLNWESWRAQRIPSRHPGNCAPRLRQSPCFPDKLTVLLLGSRAKPRELRGGESGGHRARPPSST